MKQIVVEKNETTCDTIVYKNSIDRSWQLLIHCMNKIGPQ